MKKFSRILTSRQFVLTLMFLLNISFFALSIIFINAYVYWIISLVALIAMSFALNAHNENPEKKAIWALLIILVPFFALSLFLYSKSSRGTITERKRALKISYKSSQLLVENRDTRNAFENAEPDFKRISRYLYNTALMPINTNTEVKHFISGTAYINSVLAAMDGARKYIFLEFNRVEEGKVWNEFFRVMREKARLGLEVILMYDDKSCEKGFKDKRTFLKLVNHKIKAVPFNRVAAFIPSSKYKDNRSMVVIDGTTAFCGSVNISDNCINLKEGGDVQKDSGLKLVGDAAWSLTVAFLNHYQLAAKAPVELGKYKENIRATKNKTYVQAFISSPLAGNNSVTRDICSQFIGLANKNVYITSPYIVLDDEMRRQMKLAAQSGVDVRIILSSKGKGRTLSQTYYAELIKAGVKVYEYEDGVMNAKMYLADDNCAAVGTMPLDFRKIKNNAENGVILYGKENTAAVVEDFNDIFMHSKLITLRDLKKRKIPQKMLGQILRFFAPLY